MARITVEDCLENVDNRFNLVLIAAKRARQLAEGYQSELDVENDKNTVLAPEPEETAEDLFLSDSIETEVSGETDQDIAANADSIAKETPPADA